MSGFAAGMAAAGRRKLLRQQQGMRREAAAKKSTRVCCPGRDTAARRKSFLFYFLYFTKSRGKPRSGKGFNWVSTKFRFGCADSRFAEPRISLGKGFNFVSGKLLFGWADSRFGKPQNSLQRERFLVLFAACKKYRKNTPRVATLWTPGDDSKLCRRRF